VVAGVELVVAVCAGAVAAAAVAELLVALLLLPQPVSRAREIGAATAMLALLIFPPGEFEGF
jgi:hypothetical protein